MRQLTYRGGGDLAIEPADPAPPAPGLVRVRVHATGLCLSDVYGYAGVNDRRDAVLGPGDVLVMGHEIAGRVEATGEAVAVNPIYGCGACARCAAGRDNLCADKTVVGCAPAAPGGYADWVDVPERALHPLPDGVPLEWGALAEPLAVGAHGARLAALDADDHVLVVGGGIIGLGAALAARRTVGDGKVMVLEPNARRRALAARLGLDAAAPEDVFGGGGTAAFAVAIDCVARPETLAGAIRAVPPRGRVVLVGIWADEIPLPVSDVVGRETRIMGSYGYDPSDFAGVVAWVGRREADLGVLIEDRVGFAGLIGAFEAYKNRTTDAVRTLFQPEGDK
jgi:threonine dehydrogenase-like Zn-dependent dehydrogenase